MNSNTLMMIIAAVAGLVAMILGFVFLQQQSGQGRAEPQQQIQYVEVVAAAIDIPAGAIIETERHLQTTSIPAETADARFAIRAEDIDDLQGRTLAASKLASQFILYADLRTMAELDFALEMRMVTIALDDTNAHGGLLIPGDRVDIILSKPKAPEQPDPVDTRRPAPPVTAADQSPEAMISQMMSQAMQQGLGAAGAGAGAEWETEMLFENVRVLAVDSDVARNRRQIAALLVLPDDQRIDFDSPDTVSIEVTPEQAMRFAEQTAGGQARLMIVMRSPREARELSSGGTRLPG